mgnify:CR=1 FL=1
MAAHGTSGAPITFRYIAWAPHPGTWSQCVTRDGFAPSGPLRWSDLDPAFEGVPIARQRIDNIALNCVMSNSFGFGGTNATLVFRRHDG